jgi:peptidoglycan glycosyltransferase
MDCGWENFNAAYQRLGFENAFVLAQADDLTLGTAAGKLPSLKKQRVASLAYPGFGQGDLLLSPLHIALLTATIANEGLLAYPHLEKDAPQPAPTRIWKTSTADNVKDLMAASVHHGTSKSVKIDGLSICGKTGTAEREGRPSHAWFTCFAPQDNPEIVLTVLVEHGGYGAATAIPIARNLLQRYFKKPTP